MDNCEKEIVAQRAKDKDRNSEKAEIEIFKHFKGNLASFYQTKISKTLHVAFLQMILM